MPPIVPIYTPVFEKFPLRYDQELSYIHAATDFHGLITKQSNFRLIE